MMRHPRRSTPFPYTTLFRSEGGGTFSASPLPALAQIAPIRAILTHDVEGDGHRDLIVAGNLYDAEPNTPRADAGNEIGRASCRERVEISVVAALLNRTL